MFIIYDHDYFLVNIYIMLLSILSSEIIPLLCQQIKFHLSGSKSDVTEGQKNYSLSFTV